MLKDIIDYLSKYKEPFIKICLSVSVLLIILTFGSLLASVFSLRPQTVIVLLSVGYIATSNIIKLYERVVYGHEDPLPKYVLDELDKSKKELESLKDMIANDDRINITKDEIEIMAKKEIYKEDNENEKRGN